MLYYFPGRDVELYQAVVLASDHFHDNRNECSEQSSNAVVVFYMDGLRWG